MAEARDRPGGSRPRQAERAVAAIGAPERARRDDEERERQRGAEDHRQHVDQRGAADGARGAQPDHERRAGGEGARRHGGLPARRARGRPSGPGAGIGFAVRSTHARSAFEGSGRSGAVTGPALAA